MKKRSHPKCSECENGELHHWVEDRSLTGFGCKHCPARAVQCFACEGGIVEDGDGNPYPCHECRSQWMVEVKPVFYNREPTMPPELKDEP